MSSANRCSVWGGYVVKVSILALMSSRSCWIGLGRAPSSTVGCDEGGMGAFSLSASAGEDSLREEGRRLGSGMGDGRVGMGKTSWAIWTVVKDCVVKGKEKSECTLSSRVRISGRKMDQSSLRVLVSGDL